MKIHLSGDLCARWSSEHVKPAVQPREKKEKLMRSTRFFVTVFAVLLLATPMAFGQGFQVGTISGTVTDETGGVLPGVTVTTTHLQRGTERAEITDAQGRYRFLSLPLGTYRVEASLSGFETAVRSSIRVEQDKNSVVDLRMGLAATATEITVSADAPIVDPTNVTQTTSVSAEEFQKAPVGRSYQSIVGLSAGVADKNQSNPNVSGALRSNNQFIYDGVDATDPTTGTFGSNMNFEAIQEVNVMTNGVSAEYGRATGAIIQVVTKSGTNDFEGSIKSIVTNDDWNEQNETINTITGKSFARDKVDENDIRYSGTLGGPVVRDNAWFFGAFEQWEQAGAPAQTTTVTNEEYRQARNLELHNYRLSWQITPSHQVWARYGEDPFSGIVAAYGGSRGAADLNVLTDQGQGGEQKVVQYSGVFGSNVALEAIWGEAGSIITVQPYRIGPFDNGAAVYDLAVNKYFNGIFFGEDNRVDRPREQMILAGTYFTSFGDNTHDIKVGVDLQQMESLSYYSYGNNRLYLVRDWDPATQTFTLADPASGFRASRRDYHDPGPQTSEGEILSYYVRDKFTVGPRLFVEAGLRFEDQNGHNDVGTKIVDAQSFAPRLAASYDLTGDARTLITASAGQYYDFIIQSFTDQFAQSASRANYDLFRWDPAAQDWAFDRTVITAGGSTLRPNLDLEPAEMREYTLGFQRQLGRTMGASIRYINRDWTNLIDDFYRFDENMDIETDYVNYSGAERTYQGIQTTFEKRFSNRWAMMANYTYSETEGNHFANTATALNDHPGRMCRSSDPTVGTLPCSQAIDGTRFGPASYDRPHVFNLLGTYAMNLGPANLTFGSVANYMSGEPYSKAGTVTVLDDAGEPTDQNYTYYYGGFNSERLNELWTIDGSVDAAWRVWGDVELGVKAEVFNISDNQEPDNTTTTTWCEDDTPTCQTRRDRHGAQTSRAHYQSPRSFRVTGLIRF